MVLFNYATKELTAKVVYYGPGLCGKTTNLQYIHQNLPENIKGKMLALATKTDRTLFFDFLPIDLGEIRGMKTRIQLYTVPGQVFYNETRKLVLKGADGIVFVADSQEQMLAANVESFRNLEENLRGHKMNLAEIPHVIQFNKRDLPKLAGIEQMNAAINKYNAPFYESVATTGIGVQDTLKAITKLVLLHLTKKYDPQATASGRTVSVPAPTAAAPAAQVAQPAPPASPASADGPATMAIPLADVGQSVGQTGGVPLSGVESSPKETPEAVAAPKSPPPPPQFHHAAPVVSDEEETLEPFAEQEIDDLVGEVAESASDAEEVHFVDLDAPAEPAIPETPAPQAAEQVAQPEVAQPEVAEPAAPEPIFEEPIFDEPALESEPAAAKEEADSFDLSGFEFDEVDDQEDATPEVAAPANPMVAEPASDDVGFEVDTDFDPDWQVEVMDIDEDAAPAAADAPPATEENAPVEHNLDIDLPDAAGLQMAAIPDPAQDMPAAAAAAPSVASADAGFEADAPAEEVPIPIQHPDESAQEVAVAGAEDAAVVASAEHLEPPAEEDAIVLTEVVGENELFDAPDVEVTHLEAAGEQQIVVPIVVGQGEEARRFKLSIAIKLDDLG